MENRPSGSDADAPPSGGLPGAADAGAGVDVAQKPGQPAEIGVTMDLDVALPPQPDGEPLSAEAPAPEIDSHTPERADLPPPAVDRTMTTPPPPPARPPPPAQSFPPAATPQQTPRDLRQILQAAGSIRTHFPARGSVPPSPVVKPGALHEFEVSDPASPATRRRSSATAGIAGLEELRNRIDAEESHRPVGMDLDGGFSVGPLDQLIQASATVSGGPGDLDLGGFLSQPPRAHVIDAFVRLDFDDGHVFYVRNSSVVFGRAEGASSSSFQQLGPDGSTVIGTNPFGGFDPTTTPGAMSMKREKKKRRKKKAAEEGGDAGSKRAKSTTSAASSTGHNGSRRSSAFGPRRQHTFPMFRDSFSTNPYPFGQADRTDEVPIIHLPLASSADADADTSVVAAAAAAAAGPPKKNISRRHAVLNYNFAKRRFELKITGKNGAFVEDEFVHCDTTWVVGASGMRVQIGGVGFKVVVPEVPGGGFEVDAAAMPPAPGRGKGKGKMSMSFTDEYGNEVSDEEDEEMEQGEGSRDSDESMEGESEDEEGSGDEEDEGEEEEDDEEDVDVDDEEAQEGDVENSEDESEESEESDEEAEATPPPEPVKVVKKRGRGRPRKDEAEIARQELEKAKAKEKVKEKERRHKEKVEAARRAKEAEREKERERKRLEEIRQKEERAKQKERARREKEHQKEQKKLHLPQKEEAKKAAKLYLPTPAAKKKEADKSLASQAKKGPGRPPKAKPSSPPPPLQQVHESPPKPAAMEAAAADVSVSPPIPEPEQAFSPSNPLMAVAAFNANTPAIDPALYGSASSYAPMPMQHHISHQETPKPAREPKAKKEKPPVKKRTPSPEINEADYPPEALLKPAASYVILIHEAISNSAEKALTLPQIYKAIERKYPYFKLRVTTTGWQSSVRHNLGAHKAFCKVTRSGKGWMWGINEGVSIEKEKNKASIAASRPPAYQPPMQPGMGYQSGNGVYHHQLPQGMNGYPAPNMGVPVYAESHMGGVSNGIQRPMYQPAATHQMPQYHPQQQQQQQQGSRVPPMPMPYQPPGQHPAAPPAGSPMGGAQPNEQPSRQFPNAPIPPPAGKSSGPQQQLKQNTFPPETLAAIQALQKQLAALTSQGAAASSSSSSSASASAPASVSPAILSQAQQVLAGLMSGKLTGRGLGGGTDLVKQLTKVLMQQGGAGRNGAAASGTASKSVSVPVPVPVSPSAPSLAAPAASPVSTAAPSGPSSLQGAAVAAKPAVDYKNLPPEKKRQLYLALLAAKEKKERELKEAATAAGAGAGNSGSPAGVKRPLDDEGVGHVAKKVDVGTGSGSAG